MRIDHEHFRTQGWVVVPQVAGPDTIGPLIEEICAFHRIDLRDPKTWNRIPPASWDVVPIHQSQAVWNHRQLPAVHAAFAELLGTPKLWVSMDRTGFKPPANRESAIHWDDRPRERLDRPELLRVQGMLYLTDTDERHGAFECVPSIFPNTLKWLAANPRKNDPDVKGHAIVKVPGRAGDLVIWNTLLPHRGGKNTGTLPRLTQYLTMHEAGTRGDTAAERVALWKGKRVPEHWRAWPATVRDPEPGPPAELSPLGRKLLGLDAW
jgi:Phytanoyl-CoA dioxygenase (PhyH)